MNILIIEDDPLIAEFTKRTLRMDHHRVSIVPDGTSGFRRARSGPFDAIILDLTLPGLDGISLCSSLRRLKIMTPIIVLTSDMHENTKVLSLDSGADDYMVKPFSHVELSARLRAITRRPSAIVQSQLEVGDLQLNPQEHTVMRAGVEIKLSPKEYDLLEYMMRNPGIALHKHVLLNKVWHIYSQAASNRLEVYIRQLRRKIDDPFAKNLIHTVRGIGYKLEV